MFCAGPASGSASAGPARASGPIGKRRHGHVHRHNAIRSSCKCQTGDMHVLVDMTRQGHSSLNVHTHTACRVSFVVQSCAQRIELSRKWHWDGCAMNEFDLLCVSYAPLLQWWWVGAERVTRRCRMKTTFRDWRARALSSFYPTIYNRSSFTMPVSMYMCVHGVRLMACTVWSCNQTNS